MEAAAMEAAPPENPPENTEGSAAGEEEDDEDEGLIAQAQKYMEMITSSPDNPNPRVLHALASLLELQEARYMEEADHSSSNNNRASHNIGRLGNLVRENDEFFELISSKFLSDTRYSMPVQAAAARVVLSCSLTWMYPHVFEDDVLENVKNWVLDDSARVSSDNNTWKRQLGEKKSSDFDMRRTYATGLLAVCLTSGSQVVEDVLTSGLSAKLMRYLRNRVLGEMSACQKDTGHTAEGKTVSHGAGRSRDESRGRLRQALEIAAQDDSRTQQDGRLTDQSVERDHDRSISQQVHGEEHWANKEPPDGFAEEVHAYDADVDGEGRWHDQDVYDGKLRIGDRNGPGAGRSLRDEDLDDNLRDDPSRRRGNRGLSRHRGKARVNENTLDAEQPLTSPGSGSRGSQGRVGRERNSMRNIDGKRVADSSRRFSNRISEGMAMEREDNDECFQDCRVGTKDISDLVKSAVRAAEAEARAAGAPMEAVKAAGDAAAELVKSAAIDEFKATNNEEAAVSAASRAASTVIDAANAIEVSRNSEKKSADEPKTSAAEPETNDDAVEFFIPDADALAQQREKFCIQCLDILGEYVEVLGPVLHEKGVDVCIALLVRYSNDKKELEIWDSLPYVLKLICALAAHRKFAAMFVDRGGIQKLLAVPRVVQTFFGLSSCLFTIGSLQGIMERVCALPPEIIHQVVELGLQILECPIDQARKNAALFFTSAFVFRAILDAFDEQDGLKKLLGLLHDAASVRSGGASGNMTASNGALRNERSNAEVLTSSEKQIAYHTCVALRQYFRAQLLLHVDMLRPSRSNRSSARHISSARAGYKPLDISNEAMDAVFLQIQKDRKLGAALVRDRWTAVERFLACNGHVTMLELCQAPPVDRYLHDLLQYALGILHIVTLVPYSRKLIVNATLSNDRVGIAIILDAANGPGYIDPDIIEQALNVLVNLVCPPPSISNKSAIVAQGQQSVPVQTSNAPGTDTRDRNAERNISDRAVSVPSHCEPREQNGEPSTSDRGLSVNTMQSPAPSLASGLVGDRRISLGAGAGCAGLAAQLEQGYRQAREAVRANNGIKVLLQLLQTRVVMPPATLDCLRALACRVLLGLARDDTIAHILTKLQVGKKLSEVIRDLGSQTTGTEQNRWKTELTQAAIELIAIVTNSGRASTLAASDAATPTLRRIERAAIAAATPITYHPRELLLLMHEHLQACGLSATASTLLKEAQLTPLPSVSAPASLVHHDIVQEAPTIQIQWPSGRIPGGFLINRPKLTAPQNEPLQVKGDSAISVKKKPLVFSSSFNSRVKTRPSSELQSPSTANVQNGSKKGLASTGPSETPVTSTSELTVDVDSSVKTPIVLPMKRKLTEIKDVGPSSSAKRLNTTEHGLKSPVFQTPSSNIRKGSLLSDVLGFSTPSSSIKELCGRQTPFTSQTDNLDDNQCGEPQPAGSERLTLDSIVSQYLKHQHRQCPAPITTLPPLSLLHPHVCPEPKRSLDAPFNVTARLGSREFRSMYGGIHGSRKDRQFVYSRFRPWRTCRDDAAALLTCMTFIGDSSQIAAGGHSGELKIFDTTSNNVLETCISHQSPVILVQSSCPSQGNQLVLSSSSLDVKLWDASSITGGPFHSFDGCRAARFSHSGTRFAALPTESGSQREILLYDVQTCQLDLKLTDTSSGPSGRGHAYSVVHFSPSDDMLLWNGVLWDKRVSGPVHRFDQFTDYGGGGFHPAGNEVIINSEVWDLRKFRLLRSVPSLDQTVITFNSGGDVIYAILRRNLDDIMLAVNNRRSKHPLYSAFRTVDAVNYSDIATVPVDRCVLDFAADPTDSFVGLVTMDDPEEMFSSARVYEIGRRKPPDDDSDPDDVESEEEEDDDDDDDDDGDGDPLLGTGLQGDDMSNDDDSLADIDDEDDDDDDDDEDDGDFFVEDMGFGGGPGVLEIVTEGDEDDDEDDDDDSDMMYSSGDEEYL